MNIELSKYKETHKHRIRRIIWYFVNAIVFPCLPHVQRRCLLRLFGAKVEKGTLMFPSVRIYAPWNLECGKCVCLGPRVEIYNKDKVIIGSNVVVSQGAYICTASHDITSPVMALTTAKVVIDDNCWIGAKATILPGVHLSTGVVVGACAVVPKSVREWTVVVGNPARVVKDRVLTQN